MGAACSPNDDNGEHIEKRKCQIGLDQVNGSNKNGTFDNNSAGGNCHLMKM